MRENTPSMAHLRADPLSTELRLHNLDSCDQCETHVVRDKWASTRV